MVNYTCILRLTAFKMSSMVLYSILVVKISANFIQYLRRTLRERFNKSSKMSSSVTPQDAGKAFALVTTKLRTPKVPTP